MKPFILFARFGSLMIVLMTLHPGVASAVGEPANLKVKVGDDPAAAVRELGPPLKKLDEAGGRNRWIYAARAGEKIDLHFRKGRVETIEVQLTAARSLVQMVPSELPLVELDVREPGDARGLERWFAHPASGRIWKVDPKGRTASWSIHSPWSAKAPGKPLAQLLSARPRKGGRK